MLKQFCILLILLPFIATAQTTDSSANKSDRIQHQLGVNATAFFKQFLSLNSGNITPAGQFFTPASFDYKIFKNKQNGKRTGGRFGIGFSQTDESQNPNSNFKTTIKVTNVSARAGIEFQRRIINRWSYYYGADLIFQSDTREVSTSFNNNGNGLDISTASTSENKSGLGCGPVLGFQFNINKKLSLSTETAFYFLEGRHSTNHNSTGPFGSGTMPSNNSTYFKNFGFIAPTFVNFNLTL